MEALRQTYQTILLLVDILLKVCLLVLLSVCTLILIVFIGFTLLILFWPSITHAIIALIIP